MAARMLGLLRLITGQSVALSSRPSPGFNSRALRTKAWTTASWRVLSPTATSTLPARQRCPAQPKHEPISAGRLRSRSPSGIIIR